MTTLNNQPPTSGSESSIMCSITKGIKKIFLDTPSTEPSNTTNSTTETATSISRDGQPELDDELEHSWTIITKEDLLQLSTPWTLEADRHLCILWFFTTYSITTIASLLNYSLDTPLSIRIRPSDAKDRFLLLAKQEGYTRAFVYHEIKRLSLQKGVDWTPALLAQNAVFARAWKVMARDVETERVLGEERKFRIGSEGVMQTGYDQLSEKKYTSLLGRGREWPIEERKRLQKMVWMGLGSAVVRLDDLGSQMSTEVQGVRVKQEEKKGWFW